MRTVEDLERQRAELSEQLAISQHRLGAAERDRDETQRTLEARLLEMRAMEDEVLSEQYPVYSHCLLLLVYWFMNTDWIHMFFEFQVNDTRTRILDLQREYHTAQAASQTRYEAACTRVAILEQSVQDLRTTIADAQTDTRRTSAELGATQSTNAELTRRLEERERSLHHTQSQYEGLQEELTRLQTEFAHFRADLGRHFI